MAGDEDLTGAPMAESEMEPEGFEPETAEGAPEADTPEQAEADDAARAAVAAFLASEEGQAAINRQARQRERQLARTFDQAVRGDPGAYAALRASEAGRRFLKAHEASTETQVQAWQTGYSEARRLRQLEQYDPDGFNREMRSAAGMYDWYHVTAPRFFPDVFDERVSAPLLPGAEPRRAVDADDPIAEALDDLTADERWSRLSAADQDAVEDAANLHPDNPTRAIAAMNREFGRRAAGVSVPAPRANQAEAGRAAGRTLPPARGGTGRAPSNPQLAFREARKSGRMTPEIMNNYAKWRAQQGHG